MRRMAFFSISTSWALYVVVFFFFFNDTATTEIYTLSLHDALPISGPVPPQGIPRSERAEAPAGGRSEEHTSELQSLRHLVCRLLLEKKKRIVCLPASGHISPTTGGSRSLPSPTAPRSAADSLPCARCLIVQF